MPGQRYCLPCKNAYMRKWRKENKEIYDAKKKARAKAGVYQRRGKLVPQACQRCGKLEVEKHHQDYEKPLEVEWLCRPCHLELHMNLNRIQRLALNEVLARVIADL